jgi:asparagine synthase (glutamine-hydrolysing)
MLWFGGFSGAATPRVPLGSHHLWPTVSHCWLNGTWPAREVRTTQTGHRAVAVIGPCGVQSGEVARLGTHGVPDDVAWRWPGSYVVVQADERGTTIWTDLGGAWPIYTTSVDGGVYWSSSARALAGLRGAGVDRDRLAAWLLAPAAPALLAGRSAFAAVSLVPAGHRLFLSNDGRLDARAVWQPVPRSADHAARLRAELAAAVNVRVDAASAPTVDLSGGYDSSALALLAAERVSPDRTMTAVTVHADGITDGGDLTYSHRVAQHPGITQRLMPIGQDQLPYSRLDRVPATDEPAPSTVAHARFSAQLHWMRDVCGSDCHLTGDGGDSLLCSPPLMLADLLNAGRYPRAVKEALAWSRLRRISALPLLASALRTMRTPRSVALHAFADALHAGQSSDPSAVAWFHATASPAWATTEVRERAANLAAAAAAASPDPANDLTAHVLAETMADVGRTARADVQLAEAAGIALHNPITDSRVIDTCLSVPLRARPGPAAFKPILRAAMADLFPTELAARTTKGSFTSDYYGGIRTNLNSLAALADGRLADLGLLHPTGLQRTLRLAAAGVPAAFVTVEPVIRAEVWLSAIHAAPDIPWITAQQTEGAA